MKFKPGDKVWIDSRIPSRVGDMPAGTYAAVVIGYEGSFMTTGGYTDEFWEVSLEGLTLPPRHRAFSSESIMRHRDDPPPQQEPKRDKVGSWDSCVWRPKKVFVTVFDRGERVYPVWVDSGVER